MAREFATRFVSCRFAKFMAALGRAAIRADLRASEIAEAEAEYISRNTGERDYEDPALEILRSKRDRRLARSQEYRMGQT